MDPWIRSTVDQMVENRSHSDEKNSDFFQYLMDMKKPLDKDYEDLTLEGQTLSLLTDGTETSSIVMAYAFYQVSNRYNLNCIRPDN